LRTCGALAKAHAFDGKVLIKEVAWDDPDRPGTLSAHLTPQEEAINRERGRPSDCDVVVVIV
jgi:hypothetical protein